MRPGGVNVAVSRAYQDVAEAPPKFKALLGRQNRNRPHDVGGEKMSRRELRIRFKSRQRAQYDSTANLAPEQQRRVAEYGAGESRRQSAPESSTTWVDRALDHLEPLVADEAA
jgi:hypothetical protein